MMGAGERRGLSPACAFIRPVQEFRGVAANLPRLVEDCARGASPDDVRPHDRARRLWWGTVDRWSRGAGLADRLGTVRAWRRARVVERLGVCAVAFRLEAIVVIVPLALALIAGRVAVAAADEPARRRSSDLSSRCRGRADLCDRAEIKGGAGWIN